MSAGPDGPTVLVLRESDLGAIVAQARREAPAECCGILAGESSGTVTRVFEMVNTKGSAEEFLMDPAEQFAVADELGRDSLTMLAVYHSHPASPARPSAHDISMAFYQDVAYVITSLEADEPDTRAFRIINGDPAEMPVVVSDGPAGVRGHD